MTDNYLKTWIDRAERLEEEHKAVGTDKRELFSEAKNKGYNPKALRVLLKERKQDAAERELLEADVDLYRTQIGMAVELVRDGLSLRKAARATGTTKSSIHRALAVPAPSHDPETGEIKEAALSGDDAGHRSEPSSPADQSVNPDPPLERVPLEQCNGQGEQSGTFDYDALEAMKARLDEAKRAKGFAA